MNDDDGLSVNFLWLDFIVLISGIAEDADYDEGNWGGFGEGKSEQDGIVNDGP